MIGYSVCVAHFQPFLLTINKMPIYTTLMSSALVLIDRFWRHSRGIGGALRGLEALSGDWRCSRGIGGTLGVLEVLLGYWRCPRGIDM